VPHIISLPYILLVTEAPPKAISYLKDYSKTKECQAKPPLF
ncbi:MAG: hypothetical protein ACI9VN_002574, partial [Patescibacteria group bacterium]